VNTALELLVESAAFSNRPRLSLLKSQKYYVFVTSYGVKFNQDVRYNCGGASGGHLTFFIPLRVLKKAVYSLFVSSPVQAYISGLKRASSTAVKLAFFH
jgi:hypothetical protein